MDGSNRVATWADQSGEGNNATQSTDAKKPIFTANQLNGQPSLVFDGTDDFMNCNGPIATFAGDDLPFSLFMVMRRKSLADDAPWSVGISTDNRPVLFPEFYPVNDQHYFDRLTSSINKYPSFTDETTDWVYYIWLFSGTAVTIRKNGSVGLNAADADTATFAAADLFSIGAAVYKAEANQMNFDCVEMGLWPSNISGDAIALLESYITTRYGL